ncbi:hypothetical protein ACT8ZV_19535 [Nocardioides sp. MAHUQ-72]|uniref:hypothetical protein n=1 Tax=unclassified Nocardioides TaxID=2615069 RepID=UPI00360CF24A
MKTSLAAVAASATALLLGATAPAVAAVPETPVRPAQLERGPDMKIPHLEGRTVVDGDVRVPIEAGLVVLLGRAESSGEYVVGTSNRTGDARFRVFRVTAGGERTPLLRDIPIYGMQLSGDGTQIGLATTRTGDHTRLRVWSTTDGHREASRRFPGSVSILDLDEGRMVLGSWGPDRTFWWNSRTDATRRIAGRAGYRADIRADRVAVFTKDPYLDGCSVLSTLSAPRTTLWRSCRERVEAFNPRGTRLATVPVLTDGLGPSEVRVRRDGGRLLARYTTAGWFGALDWESAKALLLDTFGKKKAATVRCVLSDCERATPLRDTPPLWPGRA